jgi:hypothetical protein
MQRHRALKNASARQSERFLDVDGGEHLSCDDRLGEPGRVPFDDGETAVGVLVALGIGPGSVG